MANRSTGIMSNANFRPTTLSSIVVYCTVAHLDIAAGAKNTTPRIFGDHTIAYRQVAGIVTPDTVSTCILTYYTSADNGITVFITTDRGVNPMVILRNHTVKNNRVSVVKTTDSSAFVADNVTTANFRFTVSGAPDSHN